MEKANKIIDAIENSKVKITYANYELMAQAGELKSKYAGNLSVTLAYEIALAKA